MADWALATIASGPETIACIEAGGRRYRLEPSMARIGLPGQGTVMDLFAHWDQASAALDALQPDPADLAPAGRLLAPLLYPGKVLCAGANYYGHLAEMGMPDAKKADQRLFFFMKPPRNAVVGEGDTVHMPIGTKAFDWEIELAAVIGRRARNVDAATAMQHVAGYTIAVDFSAATTTARPKRSTSWTGSLAKPTTHAARWVRASCRRGRWPTRRRRGCACRSTTR